MNLAGISVRRSARFRQFRYRQPGLNLYIPFSVLQKGSPIHRIRRFVTIKDRFIGIAARVHIIAVGLGHQLSLTGTDDPLRFQFVGIEFARTG